jgi:5-bromo-4-chloroindolyl phosphate hydrolysis protein
MQTNIPVTKQELQHVRKAVSRLKQELLQMKKALKKQQLLTDYPLIKTREVRKILKVSASTLQTMRNKGEIPFTRMGGLLLYDYNDIRNMLRKGQTIKKQTL